MIVRTIGVGHLGGGGRLRLVLRLTGYGREQQGGGAKCQVAVTHANFPQTLHGDRGTVCALGRRLASLA
jgi:hypothetical protein